jgi:hypothetical protein
MILIFFAALFFYLLPSILAIILNHRNVIAIVVLNILLGATLIGWIIALIWALCSDITKQ